MGNKIIPKKENPLSSSDSQRSDVNGKHTGSQRETFLVQLKKSKIFSFRSG